MDMVQHLPTLNFFHIFSPVCGFEHLFVENMSPVAQSGNCAAHTDIQTKVHKNKHTVHEQARIHLQYTHALTISLVKRVNKALVMVLQLVFKVADIHGD